MTDESQKVGALADAYQYSTFRVGKHLYGIGVKQVQEVVMPLKMTSVPLAPKFVKGLINLRGQVATAIDLRTLFGLDSGEDKKFMNVVCKHESGLTSLLVDEIGDVVEVFSKDFEQTPNTIPQSVKDFLTGVFKIGDSLLSIVDVEAIMKYVNTKK